MTKPTNKFLMPSLQAHNPRGCILRFPHAVNKRTFTDYHKQRTQNSPLAPFPVTNVYINIKRYESQTSYGVFHILMNVQ